MKREGLWNEADMPCHAMTPFTSASKKHAPPLWLFILTSNFNFYHWSNWNSLPSSIGQLFKTSNGKGEKRLDSCDHLSHFPAATIIILYVIGLFPHFFSHLCYLMPVVGCQYINGNTMAYLISNIKYNKFCFTYLIFRHI